LDIKVLKNKNYDLLAVSDALILASGTVALEAAIYETPMIISYRGPLYLFLVYRLVNVFLLLVGLLKTVIFLLVFNE
jgi:lipid-A-disaccharide synthase